MSEEEPRGVARLVGIVRRLRGPDGCDWDRAQTLTSLRAFVLEEAFELIDALDRGSRADLREELGDLLFQVVLLAQIASERSWFDLEDAAEDIADKLTRRHPHVFGGAEGEVPSWDELKAREKRGRGALEGVPVALPALARATRVGEKAARVGYDWPSVEGVRSKIDEELAELDAAPDRQRASEELGDLLFAIANWARHREIDAEVALRETLGRFTSRFERVELAARERGVDLASLSDEERDRLWEEAKRRERGEV